MWKGTWSNKTMFCGQTGFSPQPQVLYSKWRGFLDPVPRRVLGGFPTPTSKSWVAAGCPAIQLSSDTVLPGDKIRFNQVKGSFPQACPLLQGQEQIQVVTCASHTPTTDSQPLLGIWMPIQSPDCYLYFWVTVNQRVPWPFHGGDLLLEHFPELRHFTYWITGLS